MLTETFFTSIEGKQNTSNTAISKDVGIYIHALHPTHSVKSTLKKSATPPNGLAVTTSHVFAAQLGKAVVHVYSREKGNQESLVSFPERVHSIAAIGDAFLAVGTAEGRLILWEIFTGRQITTPPLHLQPITSLVANQTHVLTGSDDSNVNVWSLSALLSRTTKTYESIRSLSNHRAPITALALGCDICISASRDNTCLVWDYQTGDLLRTFLLPETPVSLALDPCDRAVYVGFENGSVQMLDFLSKPLFDPKLQSTPVQVKAEPWTAPSDLGAVLCLATTYDGTNLLSGHASGKVVSWDVGRRCFSTELTDLNSPVNNIVMQSPFPQVRSIKSATAVKPRVGTYNLSAQLTGDMDSSAFKQLLAHPGISPEVLESVLLAFSGGVDEEELWQPKRMRTV